MQIKVLVADDHMIVRAGLKQILSDTADLVVAGEAADGFEVLKKIREQAWDVLLLDMSMPGKSGIELIKQVKLEKPKLPILVLSMHQEDQYAIRAIKAGASGYLTKHSASTQLVDALRKVAGGGLFISPSVAERLAYDVRPATEQLPHRRLSDREFQIMQLIVEGKTISAIGDALCLSVKTVSTHKVRILQKMGMANVADLIRYAVTHQLIESPSD